MHNCVSKEKCVNVFSVEVYAHERQKIIKRESEENTCRWKAHFYLTLNECINNTTQFIAFQQKPVLFTYI